MADRYVVMSIAEARASGKMAAGFDDARSAEATCEDINAGTLDAKFLRWTIEEDDVAAIVDTAASANGSPGESERRPCEGWTEPLTVPDGPYYCDARAGMFTLVAYRADRNGGGLYKLWAWEVYGPGWVSVARSDRRVPLVEAQLAAESAAASLLVSALLALGETGREAMRRAMEGRR